jgi:hypothetical protein
MKLSYAFRVADPQEDGALTSQMLKLEEVDTCAVMFIRRDVLPQAVLKYVEESIEEGFSPPEFTVTLEY